MQTSIISKWAALLLTFSGMAALPLTLTAQSLTVNAGQNVSESGTSRSFNGAQALVVTGGTYTGDNVALSSTANPWGIQTARVEAGGKLSLTGGSVTLVSMQDGIDNFVIQVTGTSTLQLRNVLVTASGLGGNQGLYIENSSTAIVTGGTIVTNGVGATVNNASASFDGVTINALQSGISMSGSANVTVVNSAITASGNNGSALAMSSTGATLSATNNTIITTGNNSMGVTVHGGNVSLAGGSILTSGSRSHGVYVPNQIASTVTLTGVDIHTTGSAARGVYIVPSAGGHKTVTVNGGSIVSEQSAALGASMNNNHAGNAIDVTIKGGAQLRGVQSITVGGANTPSEAVIRVTEASTLNGDINLDGSITARIDIDDHSTLTGDILAGNLDINGNGSDATLTINLTNSSSMTGDIVASYTGALTLNMTSHARYDGNIVHDGDALILSLAADSHGKGNWQHGNLALDPTSTWTFTGSSVIDNLYNDGKVILDVNTDTGTGASLTVTNQAGGDGTVHVETTGNGTGNPNDILNNIISGPGTDNWTWDNMDWGLDELAVTKNPDGTLSTKKSGNSSTVSALSTGLIAAQKGAWFAQQNSLLKRMGDLRLLNDAYNQTTLAGKDDKDVILNADKLIDNIWIRAYGQQLNYSADVTGRGFKQYVYGVDVGTDHKWQLNADNQLFAGIFAGYGAADTDHRHHGSKSEISNYYAGLYASWLNNSGWYLDATLKAQYTDNELNGNTGANYFNGSYNNWSVGGSLEFGKQIKFKDDWFVEPQLQANYLHILASDYMMSQGLNVNVSDLDAFQLRFGIVAGKTLKLKNGGALQPYFKISGVEMVSTGGKLSAMGNTVRPNLDGARAELGAGIIWQLDAHNQLHLDYEASFGDKYDKPWGLTAGYRYQF